MSVPQRYGITVPFDGVPLHAHREWFEEIAALGYTDLWSLFAGWRSDISISCAVVSAYTRGPALLAMSAAALGEIAPGRARFGIGAGSNVIVGNWNGIPFEEPYRRVRDTIRFLRASLAGEKVTHEYDTFAVKGFRLGIRVDEVPPILVAALRPGMLRLAGREGDGAIINWLSADDVKTVVPHVGEDKEIVARIFVLPTDDEEVVRYIGKRAIAAYINVPVYAAFHAWLGRGETLQPMWDAWRAGDREAATAAIPDELVDALIVHGTPTQIREHLDRYIANGVTTPAPAFLAGPDDARRALREAAPNAS